jgi:hypothetical protein
MQRIILLPAEEAATGQWEITVPLDRDGYPDSAAWGPGWSVRRVAADGSEATGDIVPDGAGGWLFRIPPDDDAPPAAQWPAGGPSLHPGAVVLLRGPGGEATDWRVVAVTAAEG